MKIGARRPQVVDVAIRSMATELSGRCAPRAKKCAELIAKLDAKQSGKKSLPRYATLLLPAWSQSDRID